MSWTIFLLLLSIMSLISDEITAGEKLSVQDFSKRRFINEFLMDIVVNSTEISRTMIPRELLGHRLYGEEGNFVNSSIKKADNTMKGYLIFLSNLIDKMVADEDETQNESNTDMKKNSIDVSKKYPPLMHPVLKLYKTSKYLQNKKYQSDDNFENFVFLVYNSRLTLTDIFDEFARKLTATVKNPGEYAENLVNFMEYENLDKHFNCSKKVEMANLEVRHTVLLMNLMELRGMHVIVHSAWIKLLLGEVAYMDQLYPILQQTGDRIALYYDVQAEILKALKLIRRKNCIITTMEDDLYTYSMFDNYYTETKKSFK